MERDKARQEIGGGFKNGVPMLNRVIRKASLRR